MLDHDRSSPIIPSSHRHISLNARSNSADVTFAMYSTRRHYHDEVQLQQKSLKYAYSPLSTRRALTSAPLLTGRSHDSAPVPNEMCNLLFNQVG